MTDLEQTIRRIVKEVLQEYVAVGMERHSGRLLLMYTLMSRDELQRRNSEEPSEATVEAD